MRSIFRKACLVGGMVFCTPAWPAVHHFRGQGVGAKYWPGGCGFKRVLGDTLIEIMVALLLLAVAALAMVALQSWVSKTQQSARWLDIAASAATIAVEALRAGEPPNVSMALAHSSVADLPDGRVDLSALAEGQWRITIMWTEPSGREHVGRDGGNGSSRADATSAAHSCPTLERVSENVQDVGQEQAFRVARCISLVLVR
jgi:type II secretory pathway pseudopilin PulG